MLANTSLLDRLAALLFAPCLAANNLGPPLLEGEAERIRLQRARQEMMLVVGRDAWGRLRLCRGVFPSVGLQFRTVSHPCGGFSFR